MRRKKRKGADSALRLRRFRPDDPETGKVRTGKITDYVDKLDQAAICRARDIAAGYGFEI